MTRRRIAVIVAAALLAAGIALFFLSGGIIWLKVFSGFLMGTGATRLVLLARRPPRGTTVTPT